MRAVLLSGIFSSIVLMSIGAHAAKADENVRLIACYQKVHVKAQYAVTKVLIKKPERKYIARNGRIELVEFPAIYREDRTLVKPAHIVMKEINCD